MKELRALKRVFKLWNLNSTYEQVLKTAYQKNVKIFNEREFYNYFQNKDFQLTAIDEPILVLKHDVDRMLSPIAVIDKIEKKYKAASTYHVRADEAQYSLPEAQKVCKDLDVALHLVGDVATDKQNFLKYFPDVIGCSTHGGHEKQFVFNDSLIDELAEHFDYVSDGLLRPEPIRIKDKFLLIPIDSADIYLENLLSKLEETIKKNKVMILNTHVEYFTPLAYLKRQFMQLFGK
ncbi:MAG: hypothetical protein PWQ09_1745 [Candidatus Cloacimonadota bacterium]|nr:hypothetical protein [Candidatus Cloacimonadota bacterium]